MYADMFTEDKPKHKKCDKSYDPTAHEMNEKELKEALKTQGEGMKKVVTLDECRFVVSQSSHQERLYP